MKPECGSYLQSEGIGLATLSCRTKECPVARGILLFVDDKSNLLSPAQQRERIETRARVRAGMECMLGESVQQPKYLPLTSDAPVVTKP